MRRIFAMLAFLASQGDAFGVTRATPRSKPRPVIAPHPRARPVVALYEDDPWLTSGASNPLAGESLEVLFRYGPEVYWNRCSDPGEYNASVRKLMERYPRISRALAEQEINLFLSNPTGYLAKQTDERKRKGPSEDELKPPVALADKLLVLAWVAILVPAATKLTQLCLLLNETPMRETERLIDAASKL